MVFSTLAVRGFFRPSARDLSHTSAKPYSMRSYTPFGLPEARTNRRRAGLSLDAEASPTLAPLHHLRHSHMFRYETRDKKVPVSPVVLSVVDGSRSSLVGAVTEEKPKGPHAVYSCEPPAAQRACTTSLSMQHTARRLTAG